MTTRFAVLTLVAALTATPAFATEWVNCSDGSAASFNYLAGDGTGVLSVAGLTVTAGKKAWASDAAYGPGRPITVGQAYEDDRTVVIDAMDKDFVALAKLRLQKASYDDASDVYGGTLWIAGQGAWAVTCEGP